MDITEEIKKEYKKLPKELQVYLTSKRTVASMNDIAEKNNLSEEQAEELKQEIVFTLVGISLIYDFPNNILETSIPEEKYDSIVSETIEKIFEPIKESLLNYYSQIAIEYEKVELEKDDPPPSPDVSGEEDAPDYRFIPESKVEDLKEKIKKEEKGEEKDTPPLLEKVKKDPGITPSIPQQDDKLEEEPLKAKEKDEEDIHPLEKKIKSEEESKEDKALSNKRDQIMRGIEYPEELSDDDETLRSLDKDE